MRMMLTNSYGGVTFSLPASGFVWDLNDSQNGAASSVSITLFSDGSTTETGGVIPDWGAPLTAGIGSGYWVQFTQTGGGGGGMSGTIGSRVSLSTNQTWTLTRASLGVASRTFTVDFYNVASGGIVLSTGTLTMYAEWS